VRGAAAAHGGLEDRPRLVALNKIDVPDAGELAELVRPELEARGLRVFPISTKSGAGLQALTFAMAEVVAARRATLPPPAPPRIVLRPKPVGSRPGHEEFTIRRENDLWRVDGEKPERWVRQTDFGNAEAVGYLADRLNRIGIEDRLLELGARAGDGVANGGENAVVFDFAPQIDIGAEILSRRGEDNRFESQRPAAQRRRELDREYHARKAEGRADDDIDDDLR
jgi:GTP-binding protein